MMSFTGSSTATRRRAVPSSSLRMQNSSMRASSRLFALATPARCTKSMRLAGV